MRISCHVLDERKSSSWCQEFHVPGDMVYVHYKSSYSDENLRKHIEKPTRSGQHRGLQSGPSRASGGPTSKVGLQLKQGSDSLDRDQI